MTKDTVLIAVKLNELKCRPTFDFKRSLKETIIRN